MKSILLTSTALVAFAGAAAADGHATTGISFAGEAELGYNDDVEDGFFWSANLDVTATAALDNGVVATATFELEISEDEVGEIVDSDDFVLTLEAGSSKLTFGDTDPVAEDRYDGIDGESVLIGFNDKDVHLDIAGFEAMLVAETEIAGFTAAVSFGVNDDEGDLENEVGLTNDAIDAMQIYIGGSVGSVDLEFAYQDEFSITSEIFALGASTTFSNFEVGIAYIESDLDSALGVDAFYTAGPVVVGGYYSFNDEADDGYGVSIEYASGPIAIEASYEVDGEVPGVVAETATTEIEGSYDVGNGLTILAGYGVTDNDDLDVDQYYIAGEYDLGGGAELLVSYAEDDAPGANDEIGDPEYNEGTTVAISFTF